MHERRRREAGVPRTSRLAVGGPAGETTDFDADHKFSPLERMLDLQLLSVQRCQHPPTDRLVSSRLALVRPGLRVHAALSHSSQLAYAPRYIRSAEGKARAVAIGATSSHAFEAGSNRSTE